MSSWTLAAETLAAETLAAETLAAETLAVTILLTFLFLVLLSLSTLALMPETDVIHPVMISVLVLAVHLVWGSLVWTSSTPPSIWLVVFSVLAGRASKFLQAARLILDFQDRMDSIHDFETHHALVVLAERANPPHVSPNLDRPPQSLELSNDQILWTQAGLEPWVLEAA